MIKMYTECSVDAIFRHFAWVMSTIFTAVVAHSHLHESTEHLNSISYRFTCKNELHSQFIRLIGVDLDRLYWFARAEFACCFILCGVFFSQPYDLMIENCYILWCSLMFIAKGIDTIHIRIGLCRITAANNLFGLIKSIFVFNTL